LVLLAHAPSAVQERVVNSSPFRYTDRSVSQPGKLIPLLAGIRRDGYAVSDRMVDDQILSVGAPVHGPNRTVGAAVSVAVVAARQSPAALTPLVRSTALGISRALAPRKPLRSRPSGRSGGQSPGPN